MIWLHLAMLVGFFLVIGLSCNSLVYRRQSEGVSIG